MHIAESNKRIKSLLRSEKAGLCSRMGVVESQITNSMINDFDSLDLKLRKAAWVNAGIYPPTRPELLKFARTYTDCLRNSDLMAVWPAGIQKSHDDVLGYFCKGVPTVGMNVLDIFSCSIEIDIDEIWISMFENKTVLIIHPFTRSFSYQFSRLKNLHKIPILPDFNAVFSAPPVTQGINLSRTSYSRSLRQYLEDLDELISSLEIDFALIAAGGYGLPIANHLKNNKITSIYVGGALQLFFGVEGNRWRSRNELEQFRTSNWLAHPIESPPFGAKYIEGKTYW